MRAPLAARRAACYTERVADPRHAHGFVERLAFRAAFAAAEVMFPENTLGAPTARDARVVERLDRWLHAGPPSTRRAVLRALIALELSTKLYAPWPLARRFSRRSAAARSAHLTRLGASSLPRVRALSALLESTLKTAYLSDPAALRFVGVFTTRPRPGDATYAARVDALAAQPTRARLRVVAADGGAPGPLPVPEPVLEPALEPALEPVLEPGATEGEP